MPAVDYLADRQRAWLLAVIQEYQSIQAERPALRALRLPNFAIETGLLQALGHWDATHRRLTLATRLFEQCQWDQVTATLKHEMAHQVVSELYGERQVLPHGDEFRRACQLLGISPEASTPPLLAPDSGQSRIAERIRKLLALGESTNPHEAERALTKAHELALRHNLELQDLAAAPGYSFRPVGPLFRQVPSYVWNIAGIVSDFYFVLYIGRSFRPAPDAPTERCLELYGRRDNLDLAEYVFIFLLEEVERLWRAYRREHRLHGGALRLSYIGGVLSGFRAQLDATRQRLAEEKALVWVGDPGLAGFFRTRNPRVQHRGLRHRFYENAHAHGQDHGRELKLRQALHAAGNERRLLQ